MKGAYTKNKSDLTMDEWSNQWIIDVGELENIETQPYGNLTIGALWILNH